MTNPIPPGSLNPDPMSTSWRCGVRHEGRNGPCNACSCVPGGRGLRCAEDFDSGMYTPGQGNLAALMLLPERPAEAPYTTGETSACGRTERPLRFETRSFLPPIASPFFFINVRPRSFLCSAAFSFFGLRCFRSSFVLPPEIYKLGRRS